MSRPSPLLVTSQVSNDSGQNAPEEIQKENYVLTSADSGSIDLVAVERAASGSGDRPSLLSSIKEDEPIVTRRELWSYYRQSSFFLLELRCLISKFFQSVLQRK